MGTQAWRNMVPRGEFTGVGVLELIGVALGVLAPPKRVQEPASQGGDDRQHGR
jgi:hypothetical protein